MHDLHGLRDPEDIGSCYTRTDWLMLECRINKNKGNVRVNAYNPEIARHVEECGNSIPEWKDGDVLDVERNNANTRNFSFGPEDQECRTKCQTKCVAVISLLSTM